MAYATQTRAVNAGLMLDLSAVVFHTFQNLMDARAYRRTVKELSNLTTAELNDLGMNRSTIRAEARKAVYGSKA